METLGIFIGARYYWFLRKKQPQTYKTDTLTNLSVISGALIGAVIGLHLLGSLENLPLWLSQPHKIKYLLLNKTLVGGLLGGLIGVETAKQIVNEKRSTGDLFVFPLLIGMIIGRIGCLSAGVYEETYGIPSHLPWAMNLGDNIPRHPVNLYEIIFLLLLFIGLKTYQQKHPNLKSGLLFKYFMIAYLSFRFLLDFIKPGWKYFLHLSIIQTACILGIAYYIFIMKSPDRRTKKLKKSQQIKTTSEEIH